MGLYIRKALKVGPLRFNLSKSGIGVSAGITGFRLGTGPRGNYVHMGGHGLYFRKSLDSLGGDRRGTHEPPEVLNSELEATITPFEDIDSGSVFKMVDASSREILAELNEKRARVRVLPLTLALFISIFILLVVILATGWIYVVLGLVGLLVNWLAWLKDTFRKTTVIFYELEQEVENAYEQLHRAFKRLASCAKIWHIEARAGVRDRKYHAGASHVVKRRQTRLSYGQPPSVKSNVEIPLISVGAQTLAFMPDRLIVFDSKGIGAVGYAELQLEVIESRFVEEEYVPEDASVVETTWRYVNKSGGPDRRFNNNRELPVCAYEQLHFLSDSGLNELLQTSRRGVGAVFSEAILGMTTLNFIELESKQVLAIP